MTITSLDQITKIGIIGAGQMGTGIAHVFAVTGHDVVIIDTVSDQLNKSEKMLTHNLGRQLAKGLIDEGQRENALSKIHFTQGLKSLKDCDLIVEAATENQEIKKNIFRELCSLLKKEAIIATNTSSISITRLATVTDRPHRFMGMHFMNPVPLIQLVELIRGIATDSTTYQLLKDLSKKLGKTPVEAEDFPAFIVNRVLMPMINEAIYSLYEGVSSVQSIDTALKLGANHPMGPLELADFIGLDACVAIMTVLYEGLADGKYRPCPLLLKYVEAGWLGRKTGRGFYDYSVTPPQPHGTTNRDNYNR